ncbi:hypothetical protein [Cytobacillus firmus]|uniref:hypothetical protein n=1 Tax=Cytobacillus firmus TaxID=1399 RepID=UPI0021638440|nr:hypothetical protein [Cytobacillus firmus]MCS0671548.1 hypothetical protein [Cytobacillus firmus]
MVWKIYFWLMFFSAFQSLLFLLNYSDEINWSGYWLSVSNYYSPMAIVGIIGLFGYAFNKQILTKKFWKSIFWLLLVLFIFSRVQYLITFKGTLIFHYLNFKYFLLPIPLLLALYRYADIKWKKENKHQKTQVKKPIVFK